ncbi:hypothetical protein NWE50_06755 [Morganella morganii]|nr:hypothetical protein [Morganella morganii]
MTFKSLIAAVPLLLAGCVKTATPPDLSALASVVLPQERTADYRIADCHAIWGTQLCGRDRKRALLAADDGLC